MSNTENVKQNSCQNSPGGSRSQQIAGELPVKRTRPEPLSSHPVLVPDAIQSANKIQRTDDRFCPGSNPAKDNQDPHKANEPASSSISLSSSKYAPDVVMQGSTTHQRRRDAKGSSKQAVQEYSTGLYKQHTDGLANKSNSLVTRSPPAAKRISQVGASQINDAHLHPESQAYSETTSRIGQSVTYSAITKPGPARSYLDEGKSNLDGEEDEEEKKLKRLVQNRKSAQKCRVKKKEEFSLMKVEVNALKQENKDLKEKLNEVTIMLYRKIEENQSLNKRLEQNQMNHTIFLTKLLLNHENQGKMNSFEGQGSGENLHSLIKSHLASFSSSKTQSTNKEMSPSTFLQQSGLAGGKEGFSAADIVPNKQAIRKDSNMFNIKTPEILPNSSLIDMNKDHKTRSQLGDNNGSSSFQMPTSMMHMAAQHFGMNQAQQKQRNLGGLTDQMAQTLAQNSGLWNRIQQQQQQNVQNQASKQENFNNNIGSQIGEFLQKIQQQKYLSNRMAEQQQQQHQTEAKTPDSATQNTALKQNFSFQRNFS